MTFSLEKMVEKPTWKTVLLELIASKELDPWNIDLVVVADSFIKKIKEIKSLDFFVPANLILAASILLRYKSEYIRFQEDVLPVEDVGEMPDYASEGSSVPELMLSSRIPPRRQITMEELMQEIEKAMKYDTTERTVHHKGGIIDFVDLNINKFDIEKKMEEVLESVRQNVDSEGFALFSKMVDGKKNLEVIYSLLSLLHLTQKEKIDLIQDELFGEILIKLKEGKNAVVVAASA